MASSLPTEKLDRTNYASWSYKMHQYLLGHGFWSYVDGANDAAPELTHRDFPAWEQSASYVVCGRTATQLRSGCADVEGCVGEPKEGFRRENHNSEASTPIGVEEPTTA